MHLMISFPIFFSNRHWKLRSQSRQHLRCVALETLPYLRSFRLHPHRWQHSWAGKPWPSLRFKPGKRSVLSWFVCKKKSRVYQHMIHVKANTSCCVRASQASDANFEKAFWIWCGFDKRGPTLCICSSLLQRLWYCIVCVLHLITICDPQRPWLIKRHQKWSLWAFGFQTHAHWPVYWGFLDRGRQLENERWNLRPSLRPR